MSDLSAIVSRLESVTNRLEGLARSGGTGGTGDSSAGGSGEKLEAFDEQVIGGKLKEFYTLSEKLGGEVSEQSKLVKDAFQELRKILVLADKHQRPTPEQLAKVVKQLSSKVDAVVQYCEKRRSSKCFNNLMTIKEGIGCVGWVTVAPKPVPYIKECGDQSLFYGNRVIKEFKSKNENQVKWVRAYTGAITELMGYVKEYHTTGLEWNSQGSKFTLSAPSAGPPPPPPPAIQPPEQSTAPAPKSNTDSERANLFASLNKGGKVTQGLRKVTDDMKTHKNPELRGSSVVKEGDIKKTQAAPKYGSNVAAKKPPVLALQGKKWVVEYHKDRSDLALSDTNSKQTVYVFKCEKCTLKVAGKVNSIILDNCKKVALCFDDVISSAEVVNCQGIQVQVLGRCPTVSIDKTDGCIIYLSKDSLTCGFITAKSSEMNVAIPPKDGSGDYIERPIPEQFKTMVKGTTLVTEATDIAS